MNPLQFPLILMIFVFALVGSSQSTGQSWEIPPGNTYVESGETVNYLLGQSELYGTKAERRACADDFTIELSRELFKGSIVSFNLVNHSNSTHKLNFWFSKNLYSVIEQNMELNKTALDGFVGTFNYLILPVGGNFTMKLKYITNIHEGDVKYPTYFDVEVEPITPENIPCNIEEGSVVFASASITIIKETKENLFRKYTEEIFMGAMLIFFIIVTIIIYRLLISEIRKLRS